MTEDELKALFDAFDRDSNGSVDFNEFMCALRPSMSPARVSVIDEAFDKLDVNGDGVLRMDDLKSKKILIWLVLHILNTDFHRQQIGLYNLDR